MIQRRRSQPLSARLALLQRRPLSINAGKFAKRKADGGPPNHSHSTAPKVVRSALDSRSDGPTLRRPAGFSQEDPALSTILLAGFCVIGDRFRQALRPGSVIRFIVHCIIGGYFFVHFVANLRSTEGPSMLPTIASRGDSVVVCYLYHHGKGIKTGDLISFAHPMLRGEFSIKRVVAMEGDSVLRDTPGGLHGDLEDIEHWARDGLREDMYGAEQPMIKVPKGHCWVVGDNLSWSRDSRTYGPVPLALVRGRVMAIKTPGWPWKGWRII